jgi:hypothetical protein
VGEQGPARFLLARDQQALHGVEEEVATEA